ncbi:MAG: hypothetical protein RsTaC01_0919 [Candidatus Paraimprobicoccus trichonymphae]|uniref:Uncharacterized protein n=1 Tax=Candidatus Paraimprobicoccus trichonymphae TaxID=3033793 RepID=A0AA48KWG3_9FIRM|nr:MAG: hypothetical protein RsTaC01_0919 [Candidatus Paraimprobicoccus trichonymphae]
MNKILEIKKKIKTANCKSQLDAYIKEYKEAEKKLDINKKSENVKNNSKILRNPKTKNIKNGIYNEIYYLISTGFDKNIEDKYFPLTYNNQHSPLFNDDYVYKNNGVYGNIWINLTKNNHDYEDSDGYITYGDFSIADEWAEYIGLFEEGERPDNYVWHHVFMGWFGYRDPEAYLFEDGLSTTEILSNNDVNFFQTDEPFKYYDKNIGKIAVLDASSWTNCIDQKAYYWSPEDYSLLQLVHKDLIFESDYLDSCDQYVIWSDNVSDVYNGDYTQGNYDRYRKNFNSKRS